VDRARAALLTLLVAVDALLLFAVPELSAPRATTVDLKPVAYLRKHLGEQRYVTLGPITPNYGSYFGVASFDVHDFPLRSTHSTCTLGSTHGPSSQGFGPVDGLQASGS